MIDPQGKNIVVLSEFERARKGLSPTESSLLDDSRDMALHMLSRAIGEMFDKAGDELFELAEKASFRDVQTLYLDAMAQVRDRRQAVETQFRRRFQDAYNRVTRGNGDLQKAFGLGGDGLELSLVEPDDLEESLAVADMANKIREICGKELFALDKRMGHLLHDPELEFIDNPLSPETIGKAFMDACKDLDASIKVKLIIVSLFNTHMPNAVQGMYQDVNGHLAEKGVLPKIRAGLRKPASPLPASSGTGAGHGPVGEEVFATLRQLMGMARGGMPVVGASMGETGSGGPGMAAGHGVPTAEMMQALTRIQQGQAPEGAEGGPASMLDMAMLAAGTTNVLREIKASGVGRDMAELDAMTLDIVAMLFDYILDDKSIPDGMKALIGRLQIPVLKVAMLDKRFFSQKTHPTRRFLDTLADTAVGWTEEDDPDRLLHDKVETLVHRILAEFNDDVELFEEVLRDLESFLLEQEERARAHAERSALVIHERERREFGRIMALDAVRERIVQPGVPELVRLFLSDHWWIALADIHAKEGPESEAWAEALQTMDDLVWSVLPKRTAEDRKRLVGILPGLLKRLQRGMEAAAVAAQSRDDFFSKLVRAHADAVKSGMQAAKEPAEENLAEPVRSLPSLAALDRTLSEPGAVELVAVSTPDYVEEIPTLHDALFERSFSEPAESPETEVELGLADSYLDEQGETGGDAFEMAVKGLKRGAWVDFIQDDGAVLRAKLAWVSPLKGVYLFTNRLGLKAVSISPEGLAVKLREGKATLIDAAPLLDRAVNNLVEGLSRSRPE